MRTLGFTQGSTSIVFQGGKVPTPSATHTRSKATRVYRTSNGFRKQQLGREPRQVTYRGRMVAYGNIVEEDDGAGGKRLVREDRTADFVKLVSMSESSDPVTVLENNVVVDTYDLVSLSWSEEAVRMGSPLYIEFTVRLEEAV